MTKQDTLTYRVTQLEKELDSMRIDMKQVLEDKFPNLEKRLIGLDTKITIFISLGIFQIASVILLKWINFI